ncbi:MAG: DMT family transporter [Candidatus Zixiibacteriota bacterium]
MDERVTPRRATLFVAAGAVFISFSAAFVKWAHVGPTAAAFYRMLFGGVALAVIMAVRRERLWPSGRAVGLAALCGVFFALDLTFWHQSIHYVGPGLATILANFQVFFMAVVGVAFLRERLTWRLAVGILAAFAGLYLVVGVKWGELSATFHWGVLFGLITALCYTAFLLTLRRASALPPAARLSPVATIVVVSFASSAVLAALTPLRGESFAIPDLTSGAALIAYGLAGQVLGWVLITAGVPGLGASRLGLLLLLQPSLAFAWDMLFFGRPTTALDAAGVALALGAIYLGSTAGKGRGAGNGVS